MTGAITVPLLPNSEPGPTYPPPVRTAMATAHRTFMGGAWMGLSTAECSGYSHPHLESSTAPTLKLCKDSRASPGSCAAHSFNRLRESRAPCPAPLTLMNCNRPVRTKGQELVVRIYPREELIKKRQEVYKVCFRQEDASRGTECS